EKSRAEGAEGSLETKVNTETSRAIAAEGSLETKITKDIQTLKQEVDDSVEKVLDANFSSMFAQNIVGNTSDNRKYSLSVSVLEKSVQVFENGLMLEQGDDYTTTIDGNGQVTDVIFNYEIDAKWKVKFYGVPFSTSDVDLIVG
ncbi:hypothetical protein N9P74_00435, partial [bacterium]|nr:hypothetical protein [bacterium]